MSIKKLNFKSIFDFFLLTERRIFFIGKALKKRSTIAGNSYLKTLRFSLIKSFEKKEHKNFAPEASGFCLCKPISSAKLLPSRLEKTLQET
ncbi:hypothetical protein D0809_18005 [Flavobacterium circumlabens]|uniref:Uncharacterized protein n=1 Tax=Flavobacterium circumlabens TaxID=2133765 RepID=A0A4Y7U8J2_9FLAO|nr:hypothetical protein D0809_18005 [Flavobacterium circumlabens]